MIDAPERIWADWSPADEDTMPATIACYTPKTRDVARWKRVDYIRADLARALPAVQADAGWQPIETAPRDGTPILGVRFHEYMDGSRYADGAVMMFERDGIGHTGWAYMGFEVVMVATGDQPTHWMPPPPHPPCSP